MKYVVVVMALATLMMSTTAASAVYVHKCRINGKWVPGACPSTLNGKPVSIRCVGWDAPHKHRHHGRCVTPG
jgi:hypothetical protein